MIKNKQVTKTIEEYYCDNCGDKIEKNDKSDFFFISYLNNDVSFESKICGDYCKECTRTISNVFSNLVSQVFAERYNNVDIEYDKKIFEYAAKHKLEANYEEE